MSINLQLNCCKFKTHKTVSHMDSHLVENAIRRIYKSEVVGQSKSTNFNLPELRSSLKIDILTGSETL